MSNELNKLKLSLLEQFSVLEDEFRKILLEKNIQVVLCSGAWVNENGVGAGWLSCSSGDAKKEVLELTGDFQLDERNTLFDCGIYCSDGRFVEDFGSLDIGSINDIDALIDNIKTKLIEISRNGLPRYLICLVENLDNI